MKQKRLLLLSVLLLLLPAMFLGAWDTRLSSLDSPTLSLTGGAPFAYVTGGAAFPTDEYGLGLSAVSDPLDIFTLPQQLANPALFPSNSVILDSTIINTTSANGGVVLNFAIRNVPLLVGLFVARPTSTTWVIGTPRSALPGLGASYFTNAGIPGIAPTAPSNIADLLLATRFGSILVGAGVGVSYSLPSYGNASNPAGSATTSTTSSLITGRLGVSATLGPVAVDVSSLLLFGDANVSDSATGVPDSNMDAKDFSFSVNARATMPVQKTLDIVVLAEYASLPQNYSGSNAGVGFSTTTTLVDSTGFQSFGGGAGVNWKPTDVVFINALVSAIYGTVSWVDVAVNTNPRPTSNGSWIAYRALLDGEFKVVSWFTIRGGVSGTIRWYGSNPLNQVAAGVTTATKTTFFETGVNASAGLGFQITEKTVLDVLLNLINLNGAAGAMQVPGLGASLKVDL